MVCGREFSVSDLGYIVFHRRDLRRDPSSGVVKISRSRRVQRVEAAREMKARLNIGYALLTSSRRRLGSVSGRSTVNTVDQRAKGIRIMFDCQA